MVDHQLFSSLNERQKCLLENNMEHGSIPPRSYLFENDKNLRHIYFISEGTIVMGNNLGEPHENLTFLSMKPIFVGVESLLISANGEFAKALSKVYYTKIDFELFYQILCENNDFHTIIRKQIAERFNEMDDKYAQLHSDVKILDRFKFFLIEIFEKNKIKGTKKNTVELYITHFEIAQYLQCTRQSVSTLMSKFREEAVIDYDRNWIRINDFQKLLEWDID